MRVTVTTQYRFVQTDDGAIWTPADFPYSFWTRYLDVFSEVEIIGRTELRKKPPIGAIRVDGPGVVVRSLPYFIGPRQYFSNLRATRSVLREASRRVDAAILRIPCHIAWLWSQELQFRNCPFAVEMVGDPWDILSSKVLQHRSSLLCSREAASFDYCSVI